MSTKTKNWLGITVLCLGIAGFFFLMQFLGIFGSKIEYTNPVYVIKSFTPFAFMIACTYFGTRILWGAGAALSILLQLGIPLLIAFAIGYWLHA